MIVVHSTMVNPEDFPKYVEGNDAAEECFAEMKRNQRICFLAHSHIPRAWSMENGVLKPLWDFGNSSQPPSFPIEFKLEKGKRYIVNVGSVGQPRDGDPDACLAFYDDSKDKETVKLVRVAYDVDAAMKRIRDEGIMEFNAMRLKVGT
jgi:diadenosine tetraphosphatase ApaH/serine/threonine PP2A family protein phosphatase